MYPKFERPFYNHEIFHPQNGLVPIKHNLGLHIYQETNGLKLHIGNLLYPLIMIHKGYKNKSLFRFPGRGVGCSLNTAQVKPFSTDYPFHLLLPPLRSTHRSSLLRLPVSASPWRPEQHQICSLTP